MPQRGQKERQPFCYSVLRGKIQRAAELWARGKDLQGELTSNKDFTRDIAEEHRLLVQAYDIDSLAMEERSINPF